MSEPLDERYSTFREHAELRERTATLEATVLQIGPTLSRIETMVATKNQPVDHSALALQRVADLIERGKSGAGMNPLLISLGTILALAVGFVVAKFL